MPREPQPDPPNVTPAPGHIQNEPFTVDPQEIVKAQRVDRSAQKPWLTGLSGEKLAGVGLAAGVLVMMTLFLTAALLYLRSTESPACKMLTPIGEPLSKALAEGKPLPEALSTLLQQCTAQQKEFYTNGT